MHAVIEGFVRPQHIVHGDGCFEIDDVEIGGVEEREG